MSNDPEILDTIDAVFRLAASNGLTKRMGEHTIQVRARAALALAIFMPHHEAQRCLLALMTSDDIPEQIRSVAADAIREWPTDAPAES